MHYINLISFVKVYKVQEACEKGCEENGKAERNCEQ